MYDNLFKGLIPSEKDVLLGCLPLVGVILLIGGAIGGLIVWLCVK